MSSLFLSSLFLPFPTRSPTLRLSPMLASWHGAFRSLLHARNYTAACVCTRACTAAHAGKRLGDCSANVRASPHLALPRPRLLRLRQIARCKGPTRFLCGSFHGRTFTLFPANGSAEAALARALRCSVCLADPGRGLLSGKVACFHFSSFFPAARPGASLGPARDSASGFFAGCRSA